MSRILEFPDRPEKAKALARAGVAEFLLRHRFGLCAVALAVSLSANVAGFVMAKKLHAEARAAAVFPARAPAFPGTAMVAAEKMSRRIVLFGDSRILQWRNFPPGKGSEIVVSGFAGETTAQMRMRFDRDVLDLDPDVVVLQLGINDLVAIGALPERRAEIAAQCEANMRHFVEALRDRHIRTILLTIIPPASPPLWRRPFWSPEIALEVERINHRWLAGPIPDTLRVVDTRALLQDGEGHWIDGVTLDTLHITQRGYDRLNAALRPLLDE